MEADGARDARLAPRRQEDAILAFMPTITPKAYSAGIAWAMCVYLLLFAAPPATPPEAMDKYRGCARAPPQPQPSSRPHTAAARPPAPRRAHPQPPPTQLHERGRK